MKTRGHSLNFTPGYCIEQFLIILIYFQTTMNVDCPLGYVCSVKKSVRRQQIVARQFVCG